MRTNRATRCVGWRQFRAAGLMLALSWPGVPARAGTGKTAAAELIRQGNKAYDAFDNKTALEYYEKAWQVQPGNTELLTRLTWTCNNVGEDLDSAASEAYFERAITYAEKLKKVAPDQAITWFLAAITSGNLGLHRGGKQKVTLSRHVAEDAEKCIQIDPDFSPGYVVLGVYYREVATLNWALRLVAKHILGGLPSGTLEDAERMLLTGIRKDPGNVYGHFQLAKTYEEMDKPAKAVACYRKVTTLPVVDHQDPLFRKQAAARIRELE